MQVLLRSKRLDKIHNERVFQLKQDLALQDRLLELTLAEQLFNTDHFHGSEHARVFLPG